MKYIRLTERIGKGIAIKETSKNDNISIWNAIKRLTELEDKIEQGTLVDTETYFNVEDNPTDECGTCKYFKEYKNENSNSL